MFSKRGIVAVRSLKSGDGEFLQDAPLTDEQISQLQAGLSTMYSCLLVVISTGDTSLKRGFVCEAKCLRQLFRDRGWSFGGLKTRD